MAITLKQAEAKARELSKKGYTDTVDASPEESFVEYGIIRNPATGDVQYSMPTSKKRYLCDWTTVELSDAVEFLESADDGFFSFIGSTREECLESLDNEYLSNLISSANAWNGYFQESCIWID